ncbi:Homocitrate synthase subunit alpha [Clostridium bornimense]|uniref:Homocitrate synthase subunit alpha n=1 Tax=Clostridium bornimense TaxID=1216932 RepID=W6S011_9CLOT|nr:homocitrate synthase [Clostridium bornimense]CDM70246.1 Homocitrate synthase subunit alpha [Clostridium bornimense]
MENKFYIVDTTLRDGEQQAGKVFSKKDKIDIVKRLDSMGVYQIEAGIPAMCKEEKEVILSMMEIKGGCKISTWNRIKESDIYHSFDCKPDIIHISAPISDMHIYKNLRRDRKWVIDSIKRCIYIAKEKDYEVVVGLEDASRAEKKFLVEVCKIVKSLQVNRVRYSDTLGILDISSVKENVEEIIKECDIDIEFHGHNDFGMAIPLSLVAYRSGAKYIDCTIEGIGERTGNTDLDRFKSIMKYYI